jgi:hypothetical protein
MVNVFLENFKGIKGMTTESISNSMSTGAVVGGSTALMSNSGSNTVVRCPIDDNSTYCIISRTTGMVGMVIYIIMILIFFSAFLYFLYYLYKSNYISSLTNFSSPKSLKRSKK